MSDFTDAAAELLTAMQSATGNTQGTYSRGATSVTLAVVPGRSTREALSETGALIERTAKDFIVSPADLGELFPPKAGDTMAIAGGETYMVAPVIQGGAVYEQSNDSGDKGAICRIHFVRKAIA